MLASLSNLIPFASSGGRYRPIATFNNNLRGVNSLSFSRDGHYLASGGGDGVKLWDLRTKLAVPTPPHRETLGPVTRVLWVGGSDAVYPTLCYGTGLGYLCLWNQGARSDRFIEVFEKRLADGVEITALGCANGNGTDVHIAVGTRKCVIQVFQYDGRGDVSPIFSIRLERVVPSALEFTSDLRDVLVFGMYDGAMYTLGSNSGKVIKSKSLGQKIGYASLPPKQHLVVLDNISNGFDLWDLDAGTHLCTFPTGTPTRFLPRQVVFAERWKSIVAGSDHGAVYVFDRTTGAPLDVLHHAAKGLVQTVASVDRDGYSLIATGSSGEQGVVTLWQSKKLFAVSSRPKSMRSLHSALTFVVQLAMALSTVAFIFQNLGFREPVAAVQTVMRRSVKVTNKGQTTGSGAPREEMYNDQEGDWAAWQEWKTYVARQRGRDGAPGRAGRVIVL
ncbi:hypothetical protein GSI_01546 [Ganoderma sinense ZZ0214-1]|uniref:Uncharacterized protein n=1 Tax=Ganoderma sinense ZZ0214-1 TaxID=1077348 RepID=A0A2G8SQ44_9APHY|nr:hypothetical protein GSI_01546 [Ganoderma sinense ZZ0214-1]